MNTFSQHLQSKQLKQCEKILALILMWVVGDGCCSFFFFIKEGNYVRIEFQNCSDLTLPPTSLGNISFFLVAF